MGAQHCTCLPSEASAKEGPPFEDEDDDEDEQERQHAPRLRKSLLGNILKLIREIERLQANAAGEKTGSVHVLHSNFG
ncbi:MAG: hypothetical protein KAX44_05365 [Candidatus Brocadiae bacterium]|nr:hypothetical protein [Candidatus Brocadiia bacterium]